ncbi:Phenylalanine--tRNA ligase alpha subunit [Geodia barretti]|uniref:Phenylalanine--tRNA ligase alpha subunit n=1 Tax=Geodia barretti TaxID=519541 RepID=A0AA35T8S2_GEOBA|nr:Phenylalanine--tRNA ligase alpha subunit [Geodia barretti]
MASSSKELDLGGLILQVLEEKGQLDSFDFSREAGREHQTVVGAIKSLQSVGNVVSTEQRQFESWVLTGEGQEVVENGSHEARVYNAVTSDGGSLQSEIMLTFIISYMQLEYEDISLNPKVNVQHKISPLLPIPDSIPNAKVGFSKAMSAGWLRIDKSAPGGARVFRKTDAIRDNVQESLKQLAAEEN